MHARARFLIASDLDPEYVQTYEFDASGVIDIGGIVVRRRYRTAVEGSRIETVEGSNKAHLTWRNNPHHDDVLAVERLLREWYQMFCHGT